MNKIKIIRCENKIAINPPYLEYRMAIDVYGWEDFEFPTDLPVIKICDGKLDIDEKAFSSWNDEDKFEILLFDEIEPELEGEAKEARDCINSWRLNSMKQGILNQIINERYDEMEENWKRLKKKEKE